MRVINITWLGSCPNCKNHKLMLFTNCVSNAEANENDMVSCHECGSEGHVDTDDLGSLIVLWHAAETKPPVTPITKEALQETLAHLVHEGSMDFVQYTVLNAYNRAGDPESQDLHTALGIISTLRLMKEKGYI